MSILEIIFISYLGFCTLGAIIQTIIEARRSGIRTALEWVLIILVFPITIFANIFAIPLTGLLYTFKYQDNPIPETFNINYNENVRTVLLGLGFKERTNWVSKDNIAYTGFGYAKTFRTQIILAFDLREKNLLRCSVYDDNKTTRVLVDRLKKLEEHEMFTNKEEPKGE